MNSCSPTSENFPPDSCFAPQVEVSVQTHQNGTNCPTTFENQYEGRIAKEEQTDYEFQYATGKSAIKYCLLSC